MKSSNDLGRGAIGIALAALGLGMTVFGIGAGDVSVVGGGLLMIVFGSSDD